MNNTLVMYYVCYSFISYYTGIFFECNFFFNEVGSIIQKEIFKILKI